jgi:hypothetical protein
MESHAQKDNHLCLAASHIGSTACALTTAGMIGAKTYFNPVETSSEWDVTPRKYNETSDTLNTTVIRERPISITIAHLTSTKDGDGRDALKVEASTFKGDMAACVSHVLEVLNGTHKIFFEKK